MAYFAEFHEGVNIIRGQNASGKSAIVDFIFYVLGGENVPWKNEALLCNEVLAEVSLNGAAITLRRSVNNTPKNPLHVFWGNLESAQLARYDEWETYPYQRSASKESFSQILFRILKLPELRGEEASNITMHQLLRLLYVDQRTPHDEIFRSESFDRFLTRETVGHYLCGVYSGDLYNTQLHLKAVDAKLERSVSDLKSIFNVLGRSGQGSGNTTDFLLEEVTSVNDQIAKLSQDLIDLRMQSRTPAENSSTAVSRLRTALSKVQRRFVEDKNTSDELRLEIEDSKQFIAELDRRLESLDQSEATRSYLGTVKFNFCPCCLSKLRGLVNSQLHASFARVRRNKLPPSPNFYVCATSSLSNAKNLVGYWKHGC
jgi:AAA domain